MNGKREWRKLTDRLSWHSTISVIYLWSYVEQTSLLDEIPTRPDRRSRSLTIRAHILIRILLACVFCYFLANSMDNGSSASASVWVFSTRINPVCYSSKSRRKRLLVTFSWFIDVQKRNVNFFFLTMVKYPCTDLPFTCPELIEKLIFPIFHKRPRTKGLWFLYNCSILSVGGQTESQISYVCYSLHFFSIVYSSNGTKPTSRPGSLFYNFLEQKFIKQEDYFYKFRSSEDYKNSGHKCTSRLS